jgi:hypothetical protein
MKKGAVGRVGLRLIVSGALAIAAGCASMGGWGSPPPPSSAAPVASQQGAPRFVQTTGMKLTEKEQAVKVPSWIRVQDCTIVAISSPSRYACPDGKVYTSNELYQARKGS